MAYALDYSAGHPTAAAVRAAGYQGVIRYIGFDPTQRPKCIGPAEYADMAAGGIPVALVYEDHAGDMLAGRPAGRVAAVRARLWANRLGFPTGRPIYYACDTDIVGDAQMQSVLDYLRGCADADGSPARVGVYGEYDVIEATADARVAAWWWQTRAWSAGRLSGRAHLRQEIGTVTVGGVACDRNTILASDWGQTGAEPTQPAPPAEEPDMFTVRRPDGAAYLITPNRLRGISADQLAALTVAGVPAKDLTQAQISAIDAALGSDAAVVAGQALTAAQAAQAAVAQVATGQVAIRQAVGALADDEAHVIAAVRAGETGLSAAVAEVLREVAEGGAGEPGAGDPGFPDLVAERVLAKLRAVFNTPGPAA